MPMIKLTPEEVYNKLDTEFRIKEKTGGIHFDLGDVSIIVKKRDSVGNILQEWVEGWLIDNNVAYSASHSQMPPDIYLDPDDLTVNLLEVKAFNYESSPAFDIAEPLAYLEEVVLHPCMLHTKYLIFGYKMDEDTGIVTVEDMWLKDLWDITAPRNTSKVMSLGGQGKKLRPTKWYNRRSNATDSFHSLEHFLSAFIELLMADSDYHHRANGAKDRIIRAYERQYGTTLDIPWWTTIKSVYFPQE